MFLEHKLDRKTVDLWSWNGWINSLFNLLLEIFHLTVKTLREKPITNSLLFTLTWPNYCFHELKHFLCVCDDMRIGVTLHFYNFLLMIAFSKFSFSSQGRLFTNLGNTEDLKNCQNLREILFLF